MDRLLTTSKIELTRLEIMQRLKEKRVTQKESSRMLGLSTRQVKRLWRTYKRAGAQGLISQQRGKPINNRIAREVVRQAIDLLHSRYSNFGPTLAHEKLMEVHGLQFSRESVRKIMITEELWFVLCETFFGYSEASQHYLEHYGKTIAFYSDNHGIFRVNQPQPLGLGKGLTQFGRAMQELDIQIICANTPQAKGRVERAVQTLQDHLVKELRLRGICDMETGNAYLPEFRYDYNRRFTVTPQNSRDAHTQLGLKTRLE